MQAIDAASEPPLARVSTDDILKLARAFLGFGSVPKVRAQDASLARGSDAQLPAFPAVHPMWRILLYLFVSGANGRKAAVSDIALMCGMPPTTSLRYLNILTKQGLIQREPDAGDMRRVWLEISTHGEGEVTEALKAFSRNLYVAL